jgi:hypothetical protein
MNPWNHDPPERREKPLLIGREGRIWNVSGIVVAIGQDHGEMRAYLLPPTGVIVSVPLAGLEVLP